MAIIDYKIKNFSHLRRNVKVVISVFRGTYQNITYTDPITFQQVTANNVYVRVAKVRDFTFEYEVTRDMTRAEFIEKARAYLNEKIVDFATRNGHTVINQQTSVVGLEPVINKKLP